ncbi:MAG TPA: hypothetical protein VJZ27_04550, partial [Aggregatilineales bacterium]|nr:hypothetical protein [Aggregatilineales bacterium]
RLHAAGLSGVVENVEGGAFRVRVFGTAEDVVPLVSRPGFLEFVDFSGLDETTRPPDGACIRTTAQAEQFGDAQICPSLAEDTAPFLRPDDTLFETVITGDGIDAVSAIPSPSGDTWEISFVLLSSADAIFAEFTETHIGEILAIVLDGEVISAPIVLARVSGQGQITGNFIQTEAEMLANILSTSYLPRPLELIAVNVFE